MAFSTAQVLAGLAELMPDVSPAARQRLEKLSEDLEIADAAYVSALSEAEQELANWDVFL